MQIINALDVIDQSAVYGPLERSQHSFERVKSCGRADEHVHPWVCHTIRDSKVVIKPFDTHYGFRYLIDSLTLRVNWII